MYLKCRAGAAQTRKRKHEPQATGQHPAYANLAEGGMLVMRLHLHCALAALLTIYAPVTVADATKRLKAEDGQAGTAGAPGADDSQKSESAPGSEAVPTHLDDSTEGQAGARALTLAFRLLDTPGAGYIR
jgi:hypothetical protein